MMPELNRPEDPPEDPVVRTGRREACFALGLWLLAAIYTIGYCYAYGYHRPAADLTFVLWFPDWVFWGIVVPWVACAIISSLFALFFMSDEPLEASPCDAAEAQPREVSDA